MTKIWTIAWRGIYTTFTDRWLLLIMIVAPLMIATIIALAFGTGDNGSVGSFSYLPVAVVNQDAGGESGSGATLVSILQGNSGGNGNGQTCSLATQSADADTASGGPTLGELFIVTVLDDVESARSAVQNGDYVAAVIIPQGFSAALEPQINLTANTSTTQPTASLEVYGNDGSAISASIVRSVVTSITNQMLTGNVAVSATINTLVEQNPSAAMQLQDNAEANAIFNCAFSSVLSAIGIQQEQLTDNQTLPVTAIILVAVGSSQAVFFALFSGQAGVLSIIAERDQGTLQRMIVSPTPRSHILAGKLIGTFFTAVFQLVALLLALLLIASLINGELLMIWGTNILGLVAVVLALALCVAGLGIFLTGLIKKPDQVNTIGSVVNILLGLAGGAFGVALPSPIHELSLIYWGTDAFTKLTEGNPDIALNLLVLLIQGAFFFIVGAWMFNRRVEI